MVLILSYHNDARSNTHQILQVFIARSPKRSVCFSCSFKGVFLQCLLHVLPIPTFPFLMILMKFSESYKLIERLGPRTVHRLRLEYVELDVHKFHSPPFPDATCRPMYVLPIVCTEEMRNTVSFCVMQFCCVGCALGARFLGGKIFLYLPRLSDRF